MTEWNQPQGASTPTLEYVLEKIQQQFKRFKGGPLLILVAVVVVMVLWTAWFTVQPEETGIIQRFGKVMRTAGPGLHFKLPYGIELVDVRIKRLDYVESVREKVYERMISERKRIAAQFRFHESGHAIVAESVAHADPVHKISIIPRGIAALGYTQQQPTEDRYLLTRSELNDRLAVLLGGRVAEELVFNEISTGAQNDPQRASDIARAMVTEYGMSDSLGLVSYERPRQAMFLPESFSQGKNYSETKAAQIDDEIERFVDEAHQRVRKILSERRTVLDDLARLLSQKESVQGEELRRMLAAAVPGMASSSPVQPSRKTSGIEEKENGIE
jgi:cell division protease FtsH